MDLDKSKVFAMSQETWDLIKENMTDKALTVSNPIEYLSMFDGIEVIIDSKVSYNHVEVYERWMYEAVLKNGKVDSE